MANAQANVDTPSLQPDDGISLINEMCQNCLRGTCTYTRCRCRHGNEDVHFVDYPSLESSPAACFTSVTSPRPVAAEGHHRANSRKPSYPHQQSLVLSVGPMARLSRTAAGPNRPRHNADTRSSLTNLTCQTRTLVNRSKCSVTGFLVGIPDNLRSTRLFIINYYELIKREVDPVHLHQNKKKGENRW
jgi:hypothetical protein